MLDLSKLAQQMQGMSQYFSQEAGVTRQRLARAETLLRQVSAQSETWATTLATWGDRLAFLAAQPQEPLHWQTAIPTAPATHTVLATDGSQIAPNHHEIAYCYLINVGRVALHYGQDRLPLLDSLPEVFYRAEDFNQSRQWGIRTEEWLGYCRTVSEATVLAELAAQLQPASPPPTLALTDGSLIYWFLESLPSAARDRILPPILTAWAQLQQQRLPLVGYVSASRSRESLNLLRLAVCPFDTPDCATHCAATRDRAPCDVFGALRDSSLWATQLAPGQRSPLWRSSARILAEYGDHAIYFCYLHVGTEVARLEFPAWVATDETLLNTALSLTLAQVEKGFGYPVALAEAHNQAVVRGGDRTRFFALLEREMIRAGLQNVGTSYKEARKRGSIA